jgi:hypothetical protein
MGEHNVFAIDDRYAGRIEQIFTRVPAWRIPTPTRHREIECEQRIVAPVVACGYRT